MPGKEGITEGLQREPTSPFVPERIKLPRRPLIVHYADQVSRTRLRSVPFGPYGTVTERNGRRMLNVRSGEGKDWVINLFPGNGERSFTPIHPERLEAILTDLDRRQRRPTDTPDKTERHHKVADALGFSWDMVYGTLNPNAEGLTFHAFREVQLDNRRQPDRVFVAVGDGVARIDIVEVGKPTVIPTGEVVNLKDDVLLDYGQGFRETFGEGLDHHGFAVYYMNFSGGYEIALNPRPVQQVEA